MIVIFHYRHNCLKSNNNKQLQRCQVYKYLIIKMYWQLPEGQTLFAKENMKPILNENIQAEQVKLSLSDRFPARIELALVHQAANKFGVTRNDQDQTCACCDQRIGIIELPPRITLETINCPPGIILTFSFIRMTIFYMLLHFAITGLYNMYSNMKGMECGDKFYPDLKDCRRTNIFLRFSPVNKYHDPEEFQYCSILNFIFVVATFIFFVAYRKIHYEANIVASEKNQTQDEYSIFLTNVPKLNNNGKVVQEKDVREVCQKIVNKWIEQSQKSEEKSHRYLHYLESEKEQSNHPRTRVKREKGGDITYIHLCWDLSEIYEIIHNKEALQQDVETMAISIIEGANHRPSFETAMAKFKSKIPGIKEQLKNVNNQLLQLARQYSMQENRSPQFYITHFIGKAFVVFQYQHFAQIVKEEISKGQTYIGNNLLAAEWSSHPRDIYWQNLTISPRTRTRREFVTITILLGTVFFSFCACVIIQYVGMMFKPKERIVILGFGLYQIILTQLTNLVIYLVNLVLFSVMKALTEYEKHETRTYEENSLLWKSLISQFINSGIIFILLHKVLKLNLWSDQGIVLTGGSQVVTGIIYDILIKLANYSYYSKKFKLWYKYRNGPLQQPKFQSRLNAEFEWPEFDLADIYTGYICQIYIALFFSYFCPLGTFITAVGFAIQYMLDKRALASMSSVKNDYNFMMSREALKLLEKSIIIFAAGNLLFEWMFFTVSKYTIIALGLTLIFLLMSIYIPFETERKCLSKLVNYENVSYSAAYFNGMFEHTYRNKDPSTRFTSKRFLGATKNYCTLEDAQEWLSKDRPDETTPFPQYNPNCEAKTSLP